MPSASGQCPFRFPPSEACPAPSPGGSPHPGPWLRHRRQQLNGPDPQSADAGSRDQSTRSSPLPIRNLGHTDPTSRSHRASTGDHESTATSRPGSYGRTPAHPVGQRTALPRFPRRISRGPIRCRVPHQSCPRSPLIHRCSNKWLPRAGRGTCAAKPRSSCRTCPASATRRQSRRWYRRQE